MATSKINIFNALPQHASDDEDEGFSKGQAKGTQAKKGNAPNDKSKGSKQVGTTGQTEGKGKDDHKKGKGVPAPGTHTLERHSGTGTAAYEKKDGRKQGAGKGNWGNYKDDGKKREEREENEVAEETTPEPTGITLEEYYSKIQTSKAEPKINEAKAKVTSDVLMKEVLSNKATVLASKKTKDVEESKGRKKQTVDVDHHAEITTEHADLLNFRTGFIEREFRQRSDGEKPNFPRENRDNRDNKKRDEKPEGEKVEGEKTEKVEGEEEVSPTTTGEKKGYSQKPSRGGRGGQGGQSGQGRGGYKSNYTPQPKVNFQDEASFPKLG